MTRYDERRMIVRRACEAGLLTRLGCHTFRATGITVYLLNGGLFEYPQQIAAYESARTTKRYDRRNDQVTLKSSGLFCEDAAAYAPCSDVAENGSDRSRFPVAAKMALEIAGATAGTPGSPTPVGASAEPTMCTSTFGMSLMRSGS